MEWTLLILLAPVIVVPVVLLWGYAGCSFNPSSGVLTPSVPTNLAVTNVAASSVSLSWSHDDTAEGITFEVERLKDGDTAPVILPSTETSFTDTGLSPSTLYHYRVRAVLGMQTSEFSAPADATTLPPLLCFSSTLNTDQTGIEGFCIVQRIAPIRLAASGSQVFITVRGSTAANLTIDRIFISQTVDATGDLYDSAGDLTSVASAVNVPANTPVTLPPVAYTLDRTRPLLVIFDINATPGMGNVRFQSPVPATEAVIFFRPATAEAAVADRLPSAANPGATPYTLTAAIYLIERIEVA